MKDPFEEKLRFHEGAPVKEKVFKVMIPLHKVWGLFKNRKSKKKTVTNKEKDYER